MLSCCACFRRAITILLSDLPATPLHTAIRAQPPPRHQTPAGKRQHSTSTYSSFRTQRLLLSQAARHGKRHHSTIQSLRKGHHLRVLRKVLKPKSRIPLKLKALRKGPSAPTRRNIHARERNRAALDLEPTSPANDPLSHTGPAKEQYEVQFLKDPLKLAQTVLQRLRINNVIGALALVRASDREKVENVVSWNHIMDYEMSFQNVKGAWKVYNEMKKRGHKPDAHTYTIMLRGFAANARKPQAAQNALAVYNSMFAPNSAVTPNIIHTNAVINVCARCKDMDALWSIAGRLPERGTGAPDKWTFTTILNALAGNAQMRASQVQQGRRDKDDGEVDEQVRNAFDEAVADGRKLWGDVVERWRRGDLMVDRPLVCAMGRLLLLGSRRSGWEDVFGLVEQTMRIPRWRPGGDEHKTLPAPEGSDFEPVDISFASGGGGNGQAGKRAGPSNTSVYAQPGNNALSMLIQAAIMTKNVPAGKMYWDLLTDANGPYKLEPDAANLASYLRLLRISRSSKMVVDLLRSERLTRNESLAKDVFKRGTFVIAMSTCVRDKNNPNVFEHASRVLDVMQERLDGAMDPKVMEMYVNLAVLTTPGVGSAAPWRDMPFEKDSTKNHALRALKRLGPDIVNVKDLMKMKLLEDKFGGRHGRRRDETSQKGPGVDDLAAFLQSMVSAYDRLLTRGAGTGVERNLLEEWLGQKRKLSAFVTKMVGGVKSRSRGVTHEEEDGDEDGEPEEVAEIRDKRWERNPVQPEKRKGSLTKAEQRAERVKKDFPDPRDVKKKKKQQQWDIEQEEGVVVKGWGTAFGDLEKAQQQQGGKSHGMAL